MPLDPREYEKIVGKTFADNDHTPLVKLGKKTWTRWELGILGVPHPAAAVLVNRIIETLGITTASELARAIPEFRRYRKFGVTSYWVLLAIIHDAGASIAKAHGDKRTFNTLHRTELKPPAAKKRKKGNGEAS